MGADWKGILAGEHGFLFWVAVAAVATGLSLLITAACLRIRRLVRESTLRRHSVRNQPRRSPQHTENAGPVGAVTEPVPVAAQVAEPTPVKTTPELLGRSLPTLLNRLQMTADRLEKMAEDFADQRIDGPESSLKRFGDDVEYVFKASRH